MNLRVVLKEWRKSKGMTLKEFAQALCITEMDLCRFEKGKELSARKLARIAYWLFIAND